MQNTVLALALLAAAAAPVHADPAAQLAWLAGCWAAPGAEPGSGEQWSTAAGGSLVGSSRTVRNGKTVAWEFIVIRETAPGKLAYIAKPHNQPEAVFTLRPASGKGFVFENLEHDFPQRIIYRQEGDSGLHARIEGLSKGKLTGIDFAMKRVACEAGK